MSRIRSTGNRDKTKYTKKTHGAGAGKIRCSGCGIGMAVKTQQPDGSYTFVCQRCGRVYAETQM
jgi:hypothetical protein